MRIIIILYSRYLMIIGEACVTRARCHILCTLFLVHEALTAELTKHLQKDTLGLHSQLVRPVQYVGLGQCECLPLSDLGGLCMRNYIPKTPHYASRADPE